MAAGGRVGGCGPRLRAFTPVRSGPRRRLARGHPGGGLALRVPPCRLPGRGLTLIADSRAPVLAAALLAATLAAG